MSKLGSFLTTFVMAIPLAAVPFMAVYGIPELSVIAEKLAEARGEQEVSSEDTLQLAGEEEQNSENGSGLHSAPSWEDEISNAEPAAIRDSGFATGNQANVTPVNYTRDHRNLSVATMPGQNRLERLNAIPANSSSGFGQNRTHQPRSATGMRPSNQPMTWQAATAQLNQLGIQNFRLEPGNSSNEFLFVCFFTPRENPNTTLRFEAESTEPLKAVELVLEQIHRTLAL